MLRISFEKENKYVGVKKGTTLLEAIRKADVFIETPCGGKGSCGKCRVRVGTSEKLACTTIVTEDMKVEPKYEIKNLNKVDMNEEIIEQFELNEKDVLGIALDIGTTGISCYLVDINKGKILNKKSELNSQTQYGGDILSRITYSIENENGVMKLQNTIIIQINNMIHKLLKNEKDINKIYKISVAANTVMLHMLIGIDTRNLSRAPYRPEFLEKKNIIAKDIGININKEGIVTLLPSASAYVGADTIAGAIAVEFNNKKYNSIFIDIGTNGEILIISGDKIVGTSTAAGPAFETMNISCGCRAKPGAIDTFKIISDEITFTTIHRKAAKGICGSGLIDITSELLKNKVILKNGRFNNKLEGILKLRIRDKRFYITDNISISQKDIRQVQLAKGAISAGIMMLLSSMNLSITDIEEILIAGAFGYHLNTESIKTVGIIPKAFKGSIKFVGNSSLEGATLSLINKRMLNEMIKLKDEIEILELSMSEDFQECFISQLNF